ncbi:MAG: BamA/TamA family outer membrane protein, partial [Deltaproteobacteria bacterium]|nr:BamA/TamA family outer membrane protein [Deltaproteobacteria bacterium]
MKYNRAGLRFGTGYNLLGDNFISIDYRFEVLEADVPAAGSHVSFGERQPIVFGHLLPGHSILSSLIFGVVRDTRDSFYLASEGSRTAFAVELATEIIGSNYDFSKFTLAHDVYFPFGRGHSIKLALFGGLIMGDAPFFDQFFVGDFSSFVPSRVLEMNFSHLQPNLLETSIAEMRYEDLSISIGIQYSLPFYRGHRFFYGVNGFIGLGMFFLSSREYMKMDPKGYEGYQVVPMDLTANLGIKVDTEVGLFVFSLANLFRLIPSVGEAAAEE